MRSNMTMAIDETSSDARTAVEPEPLQKASGQAAAKPDACRRATRGVIPIFFTIDDSYAPYMGVALNSIEKNASPAYDYEIIIMHEPLSDEHRRKLEAFERPGFRLRFVPMGDQIEGITNRHSNKLRQDYFTLTIFFRLFIPEMFPEYDKGIYLDADIVVPGDISELYEQDLGECLIGGCRDLSIVGVPELVQYVREGVGVELESYINSGVLLMNLAELRRRGLSQRFLELLTTYHFENLAPDQDYLNVLCHERIKYLDKSWDAMPALDQEPMEDPRLIHYNLFMKPWCYEGIPYADYFWKYAADSGFADEALDNLRTYSDEQKASDTACMQRMARHGEEISRAPFNFRLAFEAGQEQRL